MIEAGKIKEFAKALQLKNRIYMNLEAAQLAGYQGIPVPPTFMTVIDYWNDRNFYKLFSDFLELDPNNVVHGEQAYEYHKVMMTRDSISAQVTVKVRFHKKGKNISIGKNL